MLARVSDKIICDQKISRIPHLVDHTQFQYRFGRQLLNLRDGDQVADQQTWPADLERRVQRPVLNGGVFGYSLAQAVLRAEWLLARYPAELLVLSYILVCALNPILPTRLEAIGADADAGADPPRPRPGDPSNRRAPAENRGGRHGS